VRVVLAHHWLTRPRGGERVLAELSRIFPEAPILTTVLDRRRDWPAGLAGVVSRARPSALQSLYDASPRVLPLLVPLMPAALRRMRGLLKGCELLLVSDAGLAKCLPVPPGARKLVYAHTPMRRLWAADPEADVVAPLRPIARWAARRLRARDRAEALGVSSWAANSATTRDRLVACYGIEAARIRVIHPPVRRTWAASSLVIPAKAGIQGVLGSGVRRNDGCGDPQVEPAAARAPLRRGLLVVSPMVRYKRDDLALLAAARLGEPLTVVGEGPERERLGRLAGPNTRFLGWVEGARLACLYEEAEGLLFCGEEDFGLVPVEAMASGCPVLAFRSGGATETVRDGVGGLFFDEQTPDAVAEGIRRLKAHLWDEAAVRDSVGRFRPEEFERQVREWVAAGRAG